MTELLEIMEQYDIPEKYNIFEHGEVEKDVKDQESCGCCWSFSATSALAYRYNKLGYNLSLSAQDGVSCYIRNCKGFNIIDPQLNLVRNGTVTEQCFPYASGDGENIQNVLINAKMVPNLKNIMHKMLILPLILKKVFMD